MNSVFLHESRRDLGQYGVAKERDQVNPYAQPKAFDVLGASLAIRDGFIFEQELLSSSLERLADFQRSCPQFSSELEIPIFCEVLCMSEAVLFRGYAPILPFQKGRALPVAAVLAAVDVEFSSHQFVAFRHIDLPRLSDPLLGILCKVCVSRLRPFVKTELIECYVFYVALK